MSASVSLVAGPHQKSFGVFLVMLLSLIVTGLSPFSLFAPGDKTRVERVHS